MKTLEYKCDDKKYWQIPIGLFKIYIARVSSNHVQYDKVTVRIKVIRGYNLLLNRQKHACIYISFSYTFRSSGK